MCLNSQIEEFKKQVEIMSNGSTVLNDVTKDDGKRQEIGIEFNYQPLNRKQRNKFFAYVVQDHEMIRKEEHNKGNEVTASNKKTMLEPSLKHQYGKRQLVLGFVTTAK